MRANRSDHAYVSLRKRSKLCLLCSAAPAIRIAAALPAKDVRRPSINRIALVIFQRSVDNAQQKRRLPAFEFREAAEMRRSDVVVYLIEIAVIGEVDYIEAETD